MFTVVALPLSDLKINNCRFKDDLKTVPGTHESQGTKVKMLFFPHLVSLWLVPWQVERKRHIGNDIVTIVFQEGDDASSSFKPSMIRSHFTRILHIENNCQRNEVVISNMNHVQMSF